MDAHRRSQMLWLILFLVVHFSGFGLVAGDGGQHRSEDQQEKPSFVKTAFDTISLLKRSQETSWDKIKSVIHQVQLQFFPPNLDFRGVAEGNSRAEVGALLKSAEKVKEAVEKSIGVSKTTAEESAKSAAKVVGEAVHRTTQKVKDKISQEQPHEHDEL